MSSLSLFVVLLCVAACLTCDVDLHYRTNNGNYLIVNPDSDTYQGIQAYDASGAVCTTTVIEIYAFSVENCGLVSMLLYTGQNFLRQYILDKIKNAAHDSNSGIFLLNFNIL